MISVLYVDDEISLLDVCKLFLEKTGTFRVDTAPSAKEALQKLIITHYDAVVSDYQMPEMNGIELLTAVRKEYPRLPFIIFTGKGREEVAIEAFEKGADFYLQKGGAPKPQFAELSQKITQVVKHRQAEEELRQSERKYRDFVELLPQTVFEIDEQGTITSVNLVALKTFGYTEQDLMRSQSVFLVIAPEDHDRLRKDIQRILSGEKLGGVEYTAIKKDGSTFPVITYSDVILHEHTPVGLRGILIDITKRKSMEKELQEQYDEVSKREKALQEREQFMDDIFSSIQDGISVLDKTMTVIRVNPTMERLYPDALPLVGRKCYEVYHNKDKRCDTCPSYKTLLTGQPANDVVPMVNKGKVVGWIDLYSFPLINSSTGELEGVIEYVRDITARWKSQENLLESEETFRTFVNESSDGFVIFDENGTVIEWNPAQERLTGIAKSDALGKSIYEIQMQLMVPDQKTPARSRDIETTVSEVLKNPKSHQFSLPSEIEIVHRDGKRHLIQQTIFPIRTSSSHRIGSIAHDITRRKHDENELKTSEIRYRRLFETAQDAILILDADSGTIIDANTFIIDLLGYPLKDLLGKKLWEIGFIKDKTVAEKAFADLKQDEYIRYEDLPLQTKDGRGIDVEFVSNLYAVNHTKIIQCNIRDITVRKRAENALALASKKLNLLSSMTRHDILNQLTVLSGSIQLASEIAEKPEITAYLNRAQTAAEIIRRQIGFTREYENIGVRAPTWQQFSAVIHSALSQIHLDTMIIDLPNDDPEIYADPLFEKVFLNLIDNTRKHGGKVSRISISFRETGHGLVICFEDNGSGIAHKDKTHIFERGYGKNTGLGLFFSREILLITGITITENGEPGKGARFEILVPQGLYKFTKAGTKKGERKGSISDSAG